MSIITRRLSLLITGDLLGDTTPEILAEEMAGTSECASDGVLLPGCPIVQNVTVTDTGIGAEVTVVAEFLAYDTVTLGDNAGKEITEQFVSDHILGAEDYWLGNGDLFYPTTVTVLRTQ